MASVPNESAVPGLIPLVRRVGATLRSRLGAHSPDAETLSLVANAQPPSVDVARRLGFALDALQHYDPARARDELLEAIAEAPGYAAAYTYLAQAWSALGYRDKALAAAEQAAQHAANLPPEQRLQTEAVVDAEHADWAKAAKAWQALAQMKPLNPEYRLQSVDAQIAAGATGAAQATLRELQRLPGAVADPRVELAAARIAGALDDARGADSTPPTPCSWHNNTTPSVSSRMRSWRSVAPARISTKTKRRGRASLLRLPLTGQYAIRAARRPRARLWPRLWGTSAATRRSA